jgi:hypothetical protein
MGLLLGEKMMGSPLGVSSSSCYSTTSIFSSFSFVFYDRPPKNRQRLRPSLKERGSPKEERRSLPKNRQRLRPSLKERGSGRGEGGKGQVNRRQQKQQQQQKIE